MKMTRHTSILSAATLSLCMSSLLSAADLGLRNGDFTTGEASDLAHSDQHHDYADEIAAVQAEPTHTH